MRSRCRPSIVSHESRTLCSSLNKLQQRGIAHYRSWLSLLSTSLSAASHIMGGSRCSVVTICSPRLLGYQYFQSKGAGVESWDEISWELCRICSTRAHTSNHRYQLLSSPSWCPRYMRGWQFCTLLGFEDTCAASDLLLRLVCRCYAGEVEPTGISRDC